VTVRPLSIIRAWKSALSAVDQTAGHLRAVAHGEGFRRAERQPDVAQGRGAEIAGDRPAAAMPFFGANEPRLAQPRHDPPHDHGIGGHHPCQDFRCDRRFHLGHVEQDMEDAGKLAVAFHETLYVT
jgi:hypothetical protein